MGTTVLVTGGAGFIGSHIVDALLTSDHDYRVVVADKLTYAGTRANLSRYEDDPRFVFLQLDVSDGPGLASVFETHRPSVVFHLAAESHVDRSIRGPMPFVQTNLVGTATLLSVCLDAWQAQGMDGKRFVHVSTDEVFGSLGSEGYFKESSPYAPSSPYSATKAGSDHLVRAFLHTYGLPVSVVHCSNTYGPRQFPEKLIPKTILCLLDSKPVPLYGTGENVRDWLWVEDCAAGILHVLANGEPGETYCLGGGNERSNHEVVTALCTLADELLERPSGQSEQLVQMVADRPGHDFRYALDSTKAREQLHWHPLMPFEEGLRATLHWYQSHPAWVAAARTRLQGKE